MANSKHTLLYITALALFCVLVTACNQQTAYYHYEHTPMTGWDKNDTLTLSLVPCQRQGAIRRKSDCASVANIPS